MTESTLKSWATFSSHQLGKFGAELVVGKRLQISPVQNSGMNQRAVNVVHHCCWLAMLPLGYPLVAGCVVQTSDTADKMCLLSGEVRLNDCDGQRWQGNDTLWIWRRGQRNWVDFWSDPRWLFMIFKMICNICSLALNRFCWWQRKWHVFSIYWNYFSDDK